MAGPVTMRIETRHGLLAPRTRPLVMGVLNVTPDSFSDGGRFDEPAAAVRHAKRLVAEGADLLDVGGESTRPGAEPVSSADEVRRVVPVIEGLRRAGIEVPVSIDTRHAATAERALDAGADLVNDASALGDPKMGPLVAERGVAVVLMHMRGTPTTMQEAPVYADVVEEVRLALRAARDRAEAAGIARARILLDPGLGFGKRTGAGVEDNAELLSGLPRLSTLGCPLLVGASRKAFIGHLSGRPVTERVHGSVAAALAAAWGGAHVLRVHDVGATVDALSVAAAVDPTEWGRPWWKARA